MVQQNSLAPTGFAASGCCDSSLLAVDMASHGYAGRAGEDEVIIMTLAADPAASQHQGLLQVK